MQSGRPAATTSSTATPEGSDWTGTPGDDGKTYSSGYESPTRLRSPELRSTASFTDIGMTGSFTVTE